MRKNWGTLMLVGLTVALAVVLVSALPALARQGHMENAIRALEKARSELEKASPGKGGHRQQAIRLINEAITEVRKGIRYDETHVTPDERRGHGGHARHVNLSDLEGMRARDLDSTMKARGFRNRGGYKEGDVSFTTWWNPSTRQCVSVATKQGRVFKVKAIFEGNCQ